MAIIPILIAWPTLMALVIPCIRDVRARSRVVYLGAGVVMALAAFLLFAWLHGGGGITDLYGEAPVIDHLMLAGEFALMTLIIVLSIKHKKYPVVLLSAGQTGLLAWSELTCPVESPAHLRVDYLTMLMIMIVALVGGLICIYAVGYMKAYHQHHTEYQDRSGFFFSMLFFFLAAMFGLVLSGENLVWMYFFWEITSVISFLLIGYTPHRGSRQQQLSCPVDESSGRAGLCHCHCGGIAYPEYGAAERAGDGKIHHPGGAACVCGPDQVGTAAVLLMAAGRDGGTDAFQRAAAQRHDGQGGRVSAHSSRSCHDGKFDRYDGRFHRRVYVYRSEHDGHCPERRQKVLAFSTVSNLGLIVACAGIGAEETIWAAVLLMIFHSVSKSMLFQAVGSIENSLGSRDIEDMHGLLLRLPRLTYIMGIGIAGMYLAPFGMLISKWVALRAFVDANNYLLVIFLAYGSATTMLYWTKWLCKLVSLHHTKVQVTDATRKDQYFSMYIHAAATLGLCLLFPLVSSRVVTPSFMNCTAPLMRCCP